jgi:hypothetical protein
MNSVDIELRLLRAAADMASLKSEIEMLRAELLQQRVKFSSDYISARQFFRESIERVSMPNFIFNSILQGLEQGSSEEQRREAYRALTEWRERSAG